MKTPEHALEATGFLDEESVARTMTNATCEDLERWWAEVSRRGTPVVDPGSDRVTFLWRGKHVRDDAEGAESVHLAMNRVTDKALYDHGLMRHVPGTDIWVRTLELEPSLRVSYAFTPMSPDQQRRSGPPRFNAYDSLLDPFNTGQPLVDRGRHGLSIHSGPAAPSQREWDDHRSRRLRGRIVRDVRALPHAEASGRARDHWLYLPSVMQNEHQAAHVPLVTIFDAEKWFGNLWLPYALEAAADSGRIPPVAVLGIANNDTPDRIARLGANTGFLRDVAEHATAWAEDCARTVGIGLKGREGRIIAGQSLGGLSALVAALELPHAFGHALAHSPSLWWTPDGASKPHDLGTREGMDWITERYQASTPEDVSVEIAIGEREGLTVPRGRILHRTMLDAGWSSALTMYTGGHDFAWWRGAVVDGLARALRTEPHEERTSDSYFDPSMRSSIAPAQY